jgi:hypothetical protein
VASVADEIRTELDRLIQEGEALLRGISVNSGRVTRAHFREQLASVFEKLPAKKSGKPLSKRALNDRVDEALKVWVKDFRQNYESWYSEALAVVSQLLPERTSDFRALYKVERRKDIDYLSYTLADYQIGISITQGSQELFDPDEAAYGKFDQQLNIVKAAKRVLGSRLKDIRGVLQADLFDSELDAARELSANGFLRAAGTLAGVVLERHLGAVVQAHTVAVRSKNPTLAHFNDALKKAGVIDVPRWRMIQRLGDLRNLCAHATGRDPTAEEVGELIDGVDRIAKTLA